MPIVSKKYEFIYYPIPKVACSSIKANIAKIMEIKLINDHPHSTPFPEIPLWASAANKYFKFAFVRNPWDRLVSCYKDKIYYCTDHTGKVNAYGDNLPPFMRKYSCFQKGMPFEDFVKAVSKIPDHAAEAHFISQHTYLEHHGDLVPNFIGKFENIGEDWGRVCKSIKIKTPSLEHRKKVADKPYKSFYTDETIEIVASRYEKDISMFGYNF
jgi:hypothetical protein